MSEPITNAPSAEPTAPVQEKTFTQADVDTIVANRLARERKNYPSEQELNDYRTWKSNQPAAQQTLQTITQERDTAQSQLSAVKAELEQAKREKYVFSKGLSGEDAEFIMFKAAKMVDEKTTFEAAVDNLTAERQKKPTFDFSAPVGDGIKKGGVNDVMNNFIRNAIK